jgi:hypothetical protein
MSHQRYNSGPQEDEVKRWEEERQYRVWMENTGPSNKQSEQSNNLTPPFCVPLSICAHQQSSSMVPSITESDESTSQDDSMDLSRYSMSPASRPRHPPAPQHHYQEQQHHHQQEQQHPQPSQQAESMIEISPGVHVRLRGADETWRAIEQDYYMPTECLCCQATIFCIQNADFVLCPDCRVVSRMEDSSSQGMGGVGLGFKYEDLARWQADIIRNRA